jgi:DNA helicase-2/ATP-dependent DNA helicase PcrA
MVILYRMNAQSRVFEEVFLNNRIPHKIVGGLRFYERAEIKDMLAYLRVLYNPADSVSLRRIINTPPRGIGAATLDALDQIAQMYDGDLYRAVLEAPASEALGLRAQNAVGAFAKTMEKLREQAGALPLHELVEKIIERSGYRVWLEAEKTIQAQSRLENLAELVTVTKEFAERSDNGSLAAVLENASLISDIDTLDTDADAVALMTLHTAKGLEFPVVFVVGMEEGIFPHSRSLWDEGELEEERRLCYVGITRAMDDVYLTRAEERTLRGAKQTNLPSRFLDEIPAELIDTEESTGPRREDKTLWQETPVARAIIAAATKKPTFPVGTKVRHPSFGEGMVVEVMGEGDQEQVKVAFPNQGIKKLLLSYANLEPV